MLFQRLVDRLADGRRTVVTVGDLLAADTPDDVLDAFEITFDGGAERGLARWNVLLQLQVRLPK